MDFESVIGIVLLLLFLGVLYYGERRSNFEKNVYPYRPQSLFDKLKQDYLLLSEGKITENYFISKYEGLCSWIHPSDSEGMIAFKQDVLRMVYHLDFLRNALNKGTTYHEFREAWKHYSPHNLPFDDSVPGVFQEGKGRAIMTRMVEAGFCDSKTLAWRQDNPSTDLLGLFVDAISKELHLKGRGRMVPFRAIWGNKNYSEYLRRARDRVNEEKNQLLEEVHKVLPDYKMPKQ